jgi:nicotinate-nucleotide adenylyltransferase
MHVIYGGTFDPVHHGHLRLSLELKDYLAVAQVHLVPSYTPPHRGVTGASADQRLRLLQLAIAGEPALAIDSRELDRGGKSFTADTLRRWVPMRLPVLIAGANGKKFWHWRILWWSAALGRC